MPTTERNPPSRDVELLSDAFSARQGLDRRTSQQIAERIAGAGFDILEAALTWAQTGSMPNRPILAGETPDSLSRRLRPSQVFTALVALRENPSTAADLLRHSPDDSPIAQARDWEASVFMALQRTPGVSRIDVQPLGPDQRSQPDFVVWIDDQVFVVEAKFTPPRLERLRRAVEQVERFVLVFRARGGIVVVPDLVEAVPIGFTAPVLVTDLAHLEVSLDELKRYPLSEPAP